MQRSDRARRHRVVAAVSWLVEWVVALALWFVLVAKLQLHELYVGAVAAAVAATASAAVRKQHVISLAGYARDFAQALRVPRYALEGTWVLAGVLARHLAGTPAPSLLREVPFDAGPDEGRAAMRRALACALTSVTPNTIVLGYDRARGRMIFHQVRRAPVTEVAKRLGARP